MVPFLLPRIIADGSGSVEIVAGAATAAAVHVVAAGSALRRLFLSTPPPNIDLKTTVRRNHLAGAEPIEIRLNKKKHKIKIRFQKTDSTKEREREEHSTRARESLGEENMDLWKEE